MYRKKLMRACLTGVMVVTLATANVAPVFAAEAPAGTESVQEPGASADLTVKFVDERGNVVLEKQLSFEEGIFNYEILDQYMPAGYERKSMGDFHALQGAVIECRVMEKAPVEETQEVKINYYDETAGKQAAEVAIEVSKDATSVDKAILAKFLPAGYNFKGTDCVIRDGYVYVAVEAIASETKEVRMIYFDAETGENLKDQKVTVGALDTEIHVDVANRSLPAGYELVLNGGGYAITGDFAKIPVRKVAAETKDVHLVYFNVENDENISDAVITVGSKDTHVHVENVRKHVPEGWVLARENDFAIDKNGNVKIPVRAEAETKEVHLIYFNVENDENISDAVITVGKKDEQVHVENVKKYVPAGWELAREKDFAIDENNNVKIPVKKATEIREAVLHITFETTDGEVVGTETVTAKGADGLDATFKLGTDFNLPEGYKLSNDRDQVTEITIPYGSTGGHTMVVEKGDLSSIVKIQFVDAENNDEVVAGGDYFVDGDGDGIFNTREITEWVPEGYELQEVGDFQVELYKETPLQLSVTKIKEDKPETPDPEEPNKPEKPEKPEKPNKEDDKKDDKKNSPKTGDETNAAAAALPAGVSLAAILAVLVKKFK